MAARHLAREKRRHPSAHESLHLGSQLEDAITPSNLRTDVRLAARPATHEQDSGIDDTTFSQRRPTIRQRVKRSGDA